MLARSENLFMLGCFFDKGIIPTQTLGMHDDSPTNKTSERGRYHGWPMDRTDGVWVEVTSTVGSWMLCVKSGVWVDVIKVGQT